MCHYANVLCQQDSYYTWDGTVSFYWLCECNSHDFKSRDAKQNAFRNALFCYNPSGILIVIHYHQKSIKSNLMMKQPSKYFDPLKVIYFLLAIFDPKIVFRDFKMASKVAINNNLNWNHLSCLSKTYIQRSAFRIF